MKETFTQNNIWESPTELNHTICFNEKLRASPFMVIEGMFLYLLRENQSSTEA